MAEPGAPQNGTSGSAASRPLAEGRAEGRVDGSLPDGPVSRAPISLPARGPVPSPRPSAPRLSPPPLEPDASGSRWERFLRSWNPPRKLKFTREGKYYLGITLGVGF